MPRYTKHRMHGASVRMSLQDGLALYRAAKSVGLSQSEVIRLAIREKVGKMLTEPTPSKDEPAAS